MNIDANKMQAEISEPWDLSITLDGQRFAVRELRSDDLLRLEKLGGMLAHEAYTLVQELFELPYPDVVEWELGRYVTVLSIIKAYLTERANRANAAVELRMRAMMNDAQKTN